jgi:hypothetical protein
LPEEIHEAVSADVASYLEFPTVRAWMYLASVISAPTEHDAVATAASGLDHPQWGTAEPPSPVVEAKEKILFPEQRVIWPALAQLIVGQEPLELPSTEVPIPVPMIQRETLDLQVRLVEALNTWNQGMKIDGLAALRTTYEDLTEAASRSEAALLPCMIAAYQYGFAAHEAGDTSGARAALEDALRRYPYGWLSEKARRILDS